MVSVILSSTLDAEILRQVSKEDSHHGTVKIQVAASSIRELLRELDSRYPGLGARLRLGVAVAIDGEIYSDPLLQALNPDSEVHFIPPIEGG
ncbi:MAG: MoaD/ThiS family protein [Pseudohongiellaceae bacterium]